MILMRGEVRGMREIAQYRKAAETGGADGARISCNN